jgi:hypothetical protein
MALAARWPPVLHSFDQKTQTRAPAPGLTRGREEIH